MPSMPPVARTAEPAVLTNVRRSTRDGFAGSDARIWLVLLDWSRTRGAAPRPTAFPWCLDPQASLLPRRNFSRAIEVLNLARNLKAKVCAIVTEQVRMCQG